MKICGGPESFHLQGNHRFENKIESFFFFFSGSLIKVKFQPLFRASVPFGLGVTCRNRDRIVTSQTNPRQDSDWTSELSFLIFFPHCVKGMTSKHRLV